MGEIYSKPDDANSNADSNLPNGSASNGQLNNSGNNSATVNPSTPGRTNHSSGSYPNNRGDPRTRISHNNSEQSQNRYNEGGLPTRDLSNVASATSQAYRAYDQGRGHSEHFVITGSGNRRAQMTHPTAHLSVGTTQQQQRITQSNHSTQPHVQVTQTQQQTMTLQQISPGNRQRMQLKGSLQPTRSGSSGLHKSVRADNLTKEKYYPEVEPISPTPEETVQDQKLLREKDDIAKKLSEMEQALASQEEHQKKLLEKKEALEERLRHPSTKSWSSVDETAEKSYANPIHAIISNNRRKAQEQHHVLSRLCEPHVDPGPHSVPLYRQPSDLPPLVQLEQKFRSSFKPLLMKYIHRRKLAEKKRLEILTQQYETFSKQWCKKLDKLQNSSKRRQKELRLRECFEKMFPEIKKNREDRERMLANLSGDGSSLFIGASSLSSVAVNSEDNGVSICGVGSRAAAVDYGMDDGASGTIDDDMIPADPVEELRKMKEYAIEPPLKLAPWKLRYQFINRNGLVLDPKLQHRLAQEINLTWTEEERNIFKEKFIQYHKNFQLISSFLERKSCSDCVQFYYLTKKQVNYKQLFKKSNARRRRQQQRAEINESQNNSAAGNSASQQNVELPQGGSVSQLSNDPEHVFHGRRRGDTTAFSSNSTSRIKQEEVEQHLSTGECQLGDKKNIQDKQREQLESGNDASSVPRIKREHLSLDAPKLEQKSEFDEPTSKARRLENQESGSLKAGVAPKLFEQASPRHGQIHSEIQKYSNSDAKDSPAKIATGSTYKDLISYAIESSLMQSENWSDSPCSTPNPEPKPNSSWFRSATPGSDTPRKQGRNARSPYNDSIHPPSRTGSSGGPRSEVVSPQSMRGGHLEHSPQQPHGPVTPMKQQSADTLSLYQQQQQQQQQQLAAMSSRGQSPAGSVTSQMPMPLGWARSDHSQIPSNYGNANMSQPPISGDSNNFNKSILLGDFYTAQQMPRSNQYLQSSATGIQGGRYTGSIDPNLLPVPCSNNSVHQQMTMTPVASVATQNQHLISSLSLQTSSSELSRSQEMWTNVAASGAANNFYDARGASVGLPMSHMDNKVAKYVDNVDRLYREEVEAYTFRDRSDSERTRTSSEASQFLTAAQNVRNRVKNGAHIVPSANPNQFVNPHTALSVVSEAPVGQYSPMANDSERPVQTSSRSQMPPPSSNQKPLSAFTLIDRPSPSPWNTTSGSPASTTQARLPPKIGRRTYTESYHHRSNVLGTAKDAEFNESNSTAPQLSPAFLPETEGQLSKSNRLSPGAAILSGGSKVDSVGNSSSMKSSSLTAASIIESIIVDQISQNIDHDDEEVKVTDQLTSTSTSKPHKHFNQSRKTRTASPGSAGQPVDQPTSTSPVCSSASGSKVSLKTGSVTQALGMLGSSTQWETTLEERINKVITDDFRSNRSRKSRSNTPDRPQEEESPRSHNKNPGKCGSTNNPDSDRYHSMSKNPENQTCPKDRGINTPPGSSRSSHQSGGGNGSACVPLKKRARTNTETSCSPSPTAAAIEASPGPSTLSAANTSMQLPASAASSPGGLQIDLEGSSSADNISSQLKSRDRTSDDKS